MHGKPLPLPRRRRPRPPRLLVQANVYEDPEEALSVLPEVRAVVCASITARRLRELGTPDALEIIEEDRTLDKGGVEMLGRMLRQTRT